jgi:peptidoglycan/LPS O-acetylase OafA/YrhL
VTAATLGRDVRPEIQALRAVAVVLVLVYHWWPSTLGGGFVGVDVFFVISGYLITAHLVREVDGTGRVSLLGFWARRARRILPAAIVVLLACTVATIAFVPRLHWDPFLAEIRWSALYVENWHLANTAVDYLAADDAPTPVRHFWSLSAEEQFYLVWPVLILAGAAIGRRAIAVVLWAVTLRSLAWASTRPRPTRPPPSSSPRRGRGSSGPAACSRSLPERLAHGRRCRGRAWR